MLAEAPNFSGLRVAAFESRRADEMARLIERLHGVARVSPSMREVPLGENPAAVDFAYRLMTGQIDIVLLLTGVGTRHLVAQVERHVDRDRFLAALSDVTTIVRGPKPLAVLKELGIEPTFRVPEPNTWREVLQLIDQHVNVANQSVAVQEYGLPNASLVAGLEARGATVRCDQGLPVGFAGGHTAAGSERAGDRGRRSRRRAVHVRASGGQRAADGRRLGLATAVREQLARLVVASIGPTTSETLRECELPVDIEPEHSKMGQLVAAAAARAPTC